jgi:hypothetical protein
VLLPASKEFQFNFDLQLRTNAFALEFRFASQSRARTVSQATSRYDLVFCKKIKEGFRLKLGTFQAKTFSSGKNKEFCKKN